jgi:hypothetical protein
MYLDGRRMTLLPRGRSDDTSTKPADGLAEVISVLGASAARKRQSEVFEALGAPKSTTTNGPVEHPVTIHCATLRFDSVIAVSARGFRVQPSSLTTRKTLVHRSRHEVAS